MPTSPEKQLTAAEIIRLLGLKPHPEGGHFCQTFRDTQLIDGKRPASTAIYFLLAAENDRTGIASMRSRVGTGTQVLRCGS